MQRYLHALEQRLLYFARRAGIKIFVGLIAASMAGLGLGFIVFGLWQVARVEWGPVTGAFVLGGGFLIVALLVFWAGTLHKRTPPPLPPPAYSSAKSASIVALVEAFFLGVNAGKNKKKGD